MTTPKEALEFIQYRRKQIAELRPWQSGDDMSGISVSAEDTKAGSPIAGDMIARNPKNHADQWLVAAAYFADNFEPAASLQCEDAVERVARDNYRLVNYLERLSMDQMQIGDNLEFVVKSAYLLADDRDYIVRILATGLVPDEAAIRADEREKCATEVEQRNWPTVGDARRIAAAIRSGGANER